MSGTATTIVIRHVWTSVGKVQAYPGRPLKDGGSTLLCGAQERTKRVVTRSDSLWLEIFFHGL